MVSVAIVEDDQQQIEQILAFFSQYRKNSGKEFSVQIYTDGVRMGMRFWMIFIRAGLIFF